jgi:protein ImuB
MPRDRAAPRVLALHLPDFPLQHVRRVREVGGDRPVAVMEEGRVVCCDAAARTAGVRPGGTGAEALAACGRLEGVPRERAAERAALQGLAEALLALAPVVEVSLPDVLLLDASAAHLLAPRRGTSGSSGAGGGSDDEGLGEQVLAERALAVAADMGYAARAVVATGRVPARALAGAAALEAGQVIRVPAVATVRALARLPVAALGLAPAVAARLAALGVRDAGALARLPQGTLAHRFGAEGAAAARLARGEDDSPLVPYVPATLPEEALDLEAPAESAEPLLFALKRLADRVAARLAGRGLGASRLKLVLKLDPRGEERVLVPLAQPTASAARWLVPMKEHLFALRLPAAVIALRLVAVEVAIVAAEQLAFGDRPEAIAALEGVLTRLAVRLGDGAVVAAEPVERYRPEGAYRTVPFRPVGGRAGADAAAPRRGGRGGAAGEASPGAGRGGGGDGDAPGDVSAPGPGRAAGRPTRLLAGPELVVAEGEGGRLTALRVGGRDRAVLAFEGPERLRGEWWAGAFDRDYYRVRLDGLGDCWVFRDGADGRLYLHGFFD